MPGSSSQPCSRSYGGSRPRRQAVRLAAPSSLVVINRPSDHEVDFYDSYQAELVFGTAVNTTMTFTTGSAWWCGAPTEDMRTDQKLTKLAVPVSGVTVYSSV